MKNLFLTRKLKTGSLNYYFFIFTFLIILSSASAQDPLKLIPSNVSGVVTMNGGSFFKKIDLDQINRLEMFQDMDERTQGKKGSKYKEFSKIYKDPASIGLNLLAKSYLYFNESKDTTTWGTHYTFSGYIMPLTKSKKFESFIKKVSDSSVIKCGTYKYCSIGYSSIVAWNSNQMLLLFVSGYGENKEGLLLPELTRVFTLPADQCIKTNKDFMASQSQSFDFNYWMNFQSFMNEALPMSYMSLPIYKDLPFIGANFYKEYYLRMNFNFNKGEIAMDAQQTLSEESGAKMKDVYGTGLNPELMKYLNKDHLLGIYSYSLNMKGIRSMLDTALTDSVKNNINEGFVELLYEKKIKEDSKYKNLQVELDSMYADLYPPVDYSKYDYDEDTVSAYDSYEDYDSTYVPEPVEITEENIGNDNSINDTTAVENEYLEENYGEDTVSFDADYSSDSTYYLEDYSYDYSDPKEDSIKKAKNDRIDLKKEEQDQRKRKLLQEKIKELNLNKDFLFDLFQGDAMGAITDLYFKETKYKAYEYDDEELKTIEVEKTKKDPFPEFLIGFTLNNVAQGNNLMNKLTKDSFLIKENNYFKIAASGSFNVYTVISNNLLLITNNEELLKKHFNGYPSEERIAKELQDILLNKTSSFYVNLKDIFMRIPGENDSANLNATYSILMNSLQSLSFTSNQYTNNISQSDMSFKLTNKLDNSFYELFRIANEIYKLHRRKF